MSQAQAKRTSLLIGCGSAALALGLVLGPAPAAAQGIQAVGNVTNGGSATINQTVPGQTTVSVSQQTTVIDWTPQTDASGNALDFLPEGAFAFFQNNSSASFVSDFAVLNRILPAPQGNVAVINGSVISRIVQFNGSSAPGGFIAFYSPTGILVGSSASFDVGRLLLTTLDTTPESFRDFYEQGATLELRGAQLSTARIQINPGAQINATPENAFFAVVAADVEMRGIARVNGSHAYVAGEAVNLTFSNGLFDITIPTGTAAAGEVVTLDGSIGGPSSQGQGDNHLIYAVARASQDPISMLLRGNLGFDPAQSAGVVNGEIILAANYDVSRRSVDGGSISDGVDAVFRGNTETSAVRADIAVTDAAVTGNLLAIGTHQVSVSAAGADSSFAGSLLLVGRENALLTASGGNDLTIAGDVLVDARDYGASGSFLQSLDLVNAAAGNALIEANAGSLISVGGRAQVIADAQAGEETLSRIAGFARGGSARISANGGSVDIQGAAFIAARGQGSGGFDILEGAESRGGSAEIGARLGGSVRIGGGVDVIADATGAQGSLFSDSTISNAFGGNARIAVRDGGGTITIVGGAVVSAQAQGGSANAAGAGSVGDAGEATVSTLESGLITIGSNLSLSASGTGGANAGGTGGTGLGGRASIFTQNGGTIDAQTVFVASASGLGGAGQIGGNGFGGIAAAQAQIGLVTIGGDALVSANGTGGSAEFGFGGRGGDGRGGNAFLQANGDLAQTARVTVSGSTLLEAAGEGGTGGGSDGVSIAAGRGGDGYGGDPGLPNQADINFNNGVYALAGGDNGTLETDGLTIIADGVGGNGGGGTGSFTGGAGGNGFGGFAQMGLALLGQNGSLGLGRASLGSVNATANGLGGRSGINGSDTPDGIGGEGTGGFAAVTLRAGDVTAAGISLQADGSGGSGAAAGIGRGGETAVLGSLGGTLVADSLTMTASGIGGTSEGAGTGADGFGGTSGILGNGVSVTINGDVLAAANGSGGPSEDGFGGNGTGGSAYVAITSSSGGGIVNISGHTSVFAFGQGGNSQTAFNAGNGRGGSASVETTGGGSVTLGSVQAAAIGRGGLATTHKGGNGTGGTVRLRANGSGSTLTVLRNVPAAATERSPAGFNMLNADGIGETTFGGDGVGGVGRGGIIEVSAESGGAVNLPVNILADPDRAADSLFMVARGIGGDSAVDGGAGGDAFGGAITLLVDGGTLVSGAATLSTFTQGGNSADPALDITGGNATGGSRTISVINNGTLTIETAGGGSGAQGGNGSGTGNGGNATAGSVLFEVLDSTANLAGVFALFNTSVGGSGQRGGSAGGGFINLNAANATINMTASPTGGAAFLLLDSQMTGGEGIAAGGDATGPSVNLTLSGSTLTGGTLSVVQSVAGGRATSDTGTGGNGIGATVQVDATGSTLALTGPLAIRASANGGEGGASGTGGAGIGGMAALQLSGSSLTLTPGGQGSPADINIRGDGSGGFGGTVGSGSGGFATLLATGGSVNAARVLLSAQGSSTGLAGQTGTLGLGGVAGLELRGAATFDADTVTIITSADTATGGAAGGGLASLTLASNSTARLTANSLFVNADAVGADPFAIAYTPGRFIVRALGGNANLGNLTATAIGNLLDPDPLASRIEAVGGNLNVASQLNAFAFGDIAIEHGSNGVIGSSALTQVSTAIQIDTRGTLSITGVVPSGPNQSMAGATGGVRGQFVDLLAGRSIFLDGNVLATDTGVRLTANRGGGQALAQSAVSQITMESGALIDGGTGTVSIFLEDGFSDPQRQSGAITLANVRARTIVARSFSLIPGSDIIVRSDGVLTASGPEQAIILASDGGEVINLHGDAGLNLTGTGHYAIFAGTPTGSQIGSFANYARFYNVADYSAFTAVDPGGNYAAFRITPVLTVTVDDIARFYGDANPAFTTSIAGFLPGDSIADISGIAQFLTQADGTSPIGQYTVDAELGSLLSAQGYQFSFAPGILTVTPRPITITANSLSRIYGNANPALTFAVGGQGLVNGDQLTGALATTANGTSGVGTYAITQGSLAAGSNYAVTFVDGLLTITPRPITITADSFSRVYGNANPALTFTVGGQGLVGNDQLSGALAAASASAGVGTSAITQGTLSAGANYAVTFNAGILTITPRPITITANNLSRVYGNANPALTFTVGGQGLANNDQLSGALATAAGLTTGVGTAAITLGTLSAGGNYTVTFTPGVLTITPRPLTVAADNLSKSLGLADPALTFSITAGDLVNGDQLSGSLVRDPGEGIASFVIRQGTLAASSNYALTFVPGTFTINPPPVSPDINNPTSFEPPLLIDGTPPPVSGESEERFGIDFPERPDAPLISEDPLLDDPVASGGDSSLYGGGTGAPAPTSAPAPGTGGQ